MHDPRDHTGDAVLDHMLRTGIREALEASDTRLMAHRSIQPQLTRLQTVVLEALKLYRSDGLIAQQIEDVTGLRMSTVSARCVELVRSGRAYTDGVRKTRSGRSAAVFKVSK